jgi:CubicO group peptidase (beta-lactamase class C family)
VTAKSEQRLGALLAALWATVLVMHTADAAPSDSPKEPTAPTAEPSTALIGGLPAFIDGAVLDAMRRDHIAGVEVAVVNASSVLLAKGYGVAALTPVTEMGADTLVRVGSISKTVVWIAIMQLVEQHRLDLDDPINLYLPPSLKIPDDGFSEPIRIKHLMTHTAGFEETILGHMIIADARFELPVATYLARYRPRRVRPPGKIAVYSNYGAALAGMIVAQVSNLTWERYAEQKVLRPLKMRSATFREILPPELAKALGLPRSMDSTSAAHLSDGFVWKEAQLAKAPPEYITHYAPAGALAASANDMSAYMLAFLDPKRFAAAGVLTEQSVQTLFQQSFSNAPGFGSIYHGLFQYPFPGGQLAIGHDGDTRYQHSIMLIVPHMNLGIFVGENTDGGLSLIERLPYMIGMYLQGQNQPAVVSRAPAITHQDVSGTYLTLRRPYHRTERVFLDLATVSVEETANGDLLVSGLTPDIDRYAPQSDGTFHEVAGPYRIAFRRDSGQLLLLDPTGANPLEREGFFAGIPWLMAILVLVHIAALAGSIQTVSDLRARGRAAGATLWDVAPLLWLSGLVIAWIAIAPWLRDLDALLTKYPGVLLPAACWLFFLAAIFTVCGLLFLAATRPRWHPRRWFLTMILALIFVTTTATFLHWGLLGFSGW